MRVDDRSFNGELLMGQLSGFRGAPAGYAVFREPFIYQVPVFASLAANSAAGSTGNNNLQIQADSDFEWTHGVYQFDLAGVQLTWATNLLPNMTVQISDTGSQQFMFNTAIPITVPFGPVNQARMLPISKVFKSNTVIAFTVQNIDATVSTGNLRLHLMGWKLKYYPDATYQPEQLPQQA